MTSTHTRDTDTATQPLPDQRTRRPLVLWGLAVWLAVAVLIRVAGHVLLAPANPLLVSGFFVSVLLLMALVTYPVYRWLEIPRGARSAAAVLASLPGTFLDVVLVLFAGTVFPAMGTGAVVDFGTILPFGYAVVLLTGFVPRDRPGP